jgi:hypothetical protein
MPLREGNLRLGTLRLWNLTGDRSPFLWIHLDFWKLSGTVPNAVDSNQLGAVVQEKMGGAPSQPGLFPD